MHGAASSKSVPACPRAYLGDVGCLGVTRCGGTVVTRPVHAAGENDELTAFWQSSGDDELSNSAIGLSGTGDIGQLLATNPQRDGSDANQDILLSAEGIQTKGVDGVVLSLKIELAKAMMQYHKWCYKYPLGDIDSQVNSLSRKGSDSGTVRVHCRALEDDEVLIEEVPPTSQFGSNPAYYAHYNADDIMASKADKACKDKEYIGVLVAGDSQYMWSDEQDIGHTLQPFVCEKKQQTH